MSKSTLAGQIEAQADGQPILYAVIGDDDDFHLDAFEPCDWPRNTPLDWPVARTWLLRRYDDGFGHTDCPAVTAWTEDRVIFIACYDGATWVTHVPRNPVGHTPQMVGGGY